MAEKHRLAAEEVARKNSELETLSTKLAKYLSPQVYQSIFTGAQTVEISSRRKKLTIFFSDIAGFTETTDNLESEELTDVLNEYLTEMSAIALSYGATIDKYIGDAMLLFFGDPESKGVREDAKSCVMMAIAMQRRMRDLEQEWRNRGLERPFRIRMGISTGFCTVGNFGSRDRMEYTIIGNEVNLAARLQSAAEPGGVLLSHETNALVQDVVLTEEYPPMTVKGFLRPIKTYKLLGTYKELVDEGRVVLQEREGLRVLVDLTKQVSSEAIEVLEEVLAELKRRS
jgi:class 3 adenylate cyclase